MAEQVNHPAHYNMGGPKEADGTAKYEVIKVIEDWSLGFKLGIGDAKRAILALDSYVIAKAARERQG